MTMNSHVQQSPLRQVLGPVASMVALTNNAEVALSMVMAQLSSSDIPQIIEAFAQLKELLNRPDRAEQYLSSKVDQLVLLCAMQYRMCISKHLHDDQIEVPVVIDLFKSITSVLDSLFKHRTLRKLASRDCLGELMPQIISIILEPKLIQSQDGPAVIKTVNLLATCIIVNADPTNMMCALIRLLHGCISGTAATSYANFTELVMKCLWKMVNESTRAPFSTLIHFSCSQIRCIDQYYDDIVIDKVLGEIHVFMKKFPRDFWKGRQDTPLRTVKVSESV